MTTSWRRTETAGSAGAYALGAAFRVSAVPERRLVRALRWKQDAVCRETSAADMDPSSIEAENVSASGSGSADSSLTKTIFFSSRIQTQPTTRKETPNTTQKKKGKQEQNTVTTRKKLETLA